MSCARYAPWPRNQCLFDDRILAGAHVLGEAADREECPAAVRAVGGSAPSSAEGRPGSHRRVIEEVGGPPGPGAGPVQRRARHHGVAELVGPQARGQAAGRQLDVRAGKGDVSPRAMRNPALRASPGKAGRGSSTSLT